jgi:topoisomerase-4 subunit A
MPAQFPNLLANGTEGIAVGMATSVPPHNLHELCDALIYLIDNQKSATCADMMQFIKGPDFPTGGIIVDSQEGINHAYATGRGSFRVRAKWEKESFSHGLYQIVVTEIPYQVQKSKLIEKIADLFKEKKIPLIGNIRDESAENIRIIIEPKGRNCSPEMIMESLFKQTPLESRVYLNMNVLSSKGAPQVMNIVEVLQEFISHRQEIVTRRTKFRIGKIEDRLEILQALKIAYLNIDEVIRIIREEDEPKRELIAKFKINDVQAEAILNIRLRALRKLEEEQINAEHEELMKEHQQLSKILDSSQQLWKVVKHELKDIQKRFGIGTRLGERKTIFEEVEGVAPIIDISAFIEREPITVICSKMGWIRSMRGHNLDLSGVKYKDGDTQSHVVETYTTDNILVCSTAGKFFTILADNIARRKGHGESIRLMLDIENHDVVNIFVYKKGQKLLLASNNGKGFIVSSDDLVASTKGGKQILNLIKDNKCVVCTPVEGDMVAVIGTNRKLIVFGIDELPEMKRGQGVILQKYRDAKLGDVKTFASNEGLSWNLGTKTRLEKDIMSWRAKRGSVGKIPPVGFPKDNKFN